MFFQGQVRSESFKAMEEGQYQLILNYGPLGKQTAESETFTIIKKKVSKPVIATTSPGPIEKKTEASSPAKKKPQFSQSQRIQMKPNQRTRISNNLNPWKSNSVLTGL